MTNPHDDGVDPHDLGVDWEAERRALAMVYQYGQDAVDALQAAGVTREVFWSTRHRKAWTALCAESTDGRVPADSPKSEVTMVLALEKLGGWTETGVRDVVLLSLDRAPDIATRLLATLDLRQARARHAERKDELTQLEKDWGALDAEQRRARIDKLQLSDPVARHTKPLSPILAAAPISAAGGIASLQKVAEAPIPALLTEGVAPVLPRGTLACVAGPGGIGKGLFTVHLAVSIASGRKLLDTWTVPKDAVGPVLWVSVEDGRDEMHRRLWHAVKGDSDLWPVLDRQLYPVPIDKPIVLEVGFKHWQATDTHRELVELVARVKPSLVILDPLTCIAPAAEHDSAAATYAMGLLRQYTAHGATVLVVAHTRKPSNNGKPSAHDVRGSSAIVNGFRWVAMVDQDDKDGPTRLHVAKTNNTGLHDLKWAWSSSKLTITPHMSSPSVNGASDASKKLLRALK